MVKIVFFLNQPNIKEKDLSDLMTKSYKLGGSEYEILLVSYFIEKRNNGIQSYLLSNYNGKVPHQKFFHVNNLEEACEFCVKNTIKKLVVDIKQFKEDTIKKYSSKIEFLIWAHNIIGEYYLNKCLTYSCVQKIICVSQSQMFSYQSHPAFMKSCYIYNIIPFKEKDFYKNKITSRDQHNVVYMGCIRPDKGFHVIAKAWPEVLKRIPDAQLYIIGNGQLYGKNITLGKHGIATQEYEDVFLPFLTDNKGNILPSVHFLGLLGDEKYDVMGKCKVGVPNPTNSTETFCISGVEMELMGCSVTTLKLPVYEETQLNKNYLFEVESQLSDFIIKRLTDEPDRFEDLYSFVTNKFSMENSISRWEQLIKSNDVEYIGKLAIMVREIKIMVAKYHFLFITRLYNFIKYRIHLYFIKKG